MDFGSAIDVLDAMTGELVEARISGTDADARAVATFIGVLSRMPLLEPPPDMPAGAVVEESVIFVLNEGTAYITLYPSRFVEAEMWEHPPDWLDLRTHDGRVTVGPKRPAWAD